MTTPPLSEAVARFAAAYVSTADLTGPHGAARQAAFWCLALLRDGSPERSRRAARQLLSEVLGRAATGADVVAILETEWAVPPDVAGAILAAFGTG